MIETIAYRGLLYPGFQAEGNAAQFAIPYALKVCSGFGFDIGCKYRAWSFPTSVPIDRDLPDEYHALNLPRSNVDYIFSSHCLEHVDNWVETLDYWHDTLRVGGVLFLYLPSYRQEYWRPWNSPHHKHVFSPEILYDYMTDRGYTDIFPSEIDLNDSFMIFGAKGKKQ